MNKNATYQQLRSHLAYLKLAAAAEELPAALEAAEKDKPGYTQFLHDLLAVEVTATERLKGVRTLIWPESCVEWALERIAGCLVLRLPRVCVAPEAADPRRPAR